MRGPLTDWDSVQPGDVVEWLNPDQDTYWQFTLTGVMGFDGDRMLLDVEERPHPVIVYRHWPVRVVAA